MSSLVVGEPHLLLDVISKAASALLALLFHALIKLALPGGPLRVVYPCASGAMQDCRVQFIGIDLD